MDNDPKTLLKQLVSNLELASMRAYALIDPETGFHYGNRLHFMAQLLRLAQTEAAKILTEAYPAEHLDMIKLFEDKIHEEVAVPQHFYDSPIQVE